MSREVRKYHLLRRFVSGICILFLFPALGSAAVPGGLRDTLSVAEKKDSIVEAMITADRHAEQARSQTGHKRLEKGDFIYGNVVFSSPDLIKAIQNLPGVNAGTELMSGLYVHGGEGSDNLFLLDGNIIADLSSSESASFQMYLYAVPSAAGNWEFSEEARCTLKVYRNSELIDVKDYITIESFYGLIADEYAVSPGDEVTVTAESDGFLTASASTVIPENPPAIEIACSRDGDNLDVRFSFGDNAGTDDAYAFSFRTLASDGKPGDNDPGNLVELPYGDLGSPVIDNGPFDVVWEDGYSYYCIRDDSFNGGRKEIELTFTSFPFSSDMTSYFRIEVRHVSPERILYETAVADKASNILGFVGLAPVTFAYTNVSGGSGCFSGVNTAYTDWVEIPD